jgi:hypothetical protein
MRAAALVLACGAWGVEGTVLPPSRPSGGPPRRCSDVTVVLADEGHPMLRDIVAMLEWGLRALGHDVLRHASPPCLSTWEARFTHPVVDIGRCGAEGGDPFPPSSHAADTITIVTMACTTPNGYIARMPRATIVYQLEPLSPFPAFDANGAPEMAAYGNPCCSSPGRRDFLDAGLVVWDYSRGNARTLHAPFCQLNTSLLEVLPLFLFPGLLLGDAPPPYTDEGKDLDVLFVGTISPEDRRWALLSALRDEGLKVLIIAASFDTASRERDIARAKVVVNIHRQTSSWATLPEASKRAAVWPLELIRLQVLLANGAVVVSEESEAWDMAPLLAAGAMQFAPYDGLAETVLRAVRTPLAKRKAASARARAFSVSRQMDEVLAGPVQRAVRHLLGFSCVY